MVRIIYTSSKSEVARDRIFLGSRNQNAKKYEIGAFISTKNRKIPDIFFDFLIFFRIFENPGDFYRGMGFPSKKQLLI